MNADGTPKLNGVGGGTKEYIYNQPRANGVNWRYIRLADVYLLYAEALLNGATQGKLTAAEAVNLVRNRANLASLSQVTLDDVKREKLERLGASALSNAELLAILIGPGSRDESAVDLMKRIMSNNDQPST